MWIGVYTKNSARQMDIKPVQLEQMISEIWGFDLGQVTEIVDQSQVVWLLRNGSPVGIREFQPGDEKLPCQFIDGSLFFGTDYNGAD